MRDHQKQMIEQYIRAYNAFDVAGMTEHLHEDVVFENITDGQVDLSTRGIAAFRQQAELATGFFSQREQKITGWEVEDDQITIQIDYHGVLAVDLPHGMKAGDTLQLRGRSTFTFRDGQIVKIQDES